MPNRPRRMGGPGEARRDGLRGGALLGRPLPLLLIIAEKVVVAVSFAAAAVLAFAVRGRVLDPLTFLFAGELAEDPHDAVVHWLMSLAPRWTLHVGGWMAIGLALWAILFAIEALGLWAKRVWAEALVIIETASFLPFELWNGIHQSRPFGWVTLAVNVAVLLYLVHLYRQHRAPRPHP